jgi:hypothetical protein
MKRFIKYLIKKTITDRFAHWYTEPIYEQYRQLLKFAQLSYSQEGEDALLFELLGHQSTGFYVDIGAHHPMRFSNTYFFYQKGWRGINVDASPGSMIEFNALRKLDINVEIGIDADEGSKIFYMFNEPGLNTFDQDRMMEIVKIPDYKLVNQVEVSTITLSNLLDKFLPKGLEIDFLNLDAEELDYHILNTNNWEKYRPKFILTEHYTNDFHEIFNSRVYLLLTGHGYELKAKTYRNLIFARR